MPSIEFARFAQLVFPAAVFIFKDRRNISIGCKGDSRPRFSAGQLAKGCTKSCPDISRVYQSQCGSRVPDTATLDAARIARPTESEQEREGGERGEKRWLRSPMLPLHRRPVVVTSRSYASIRYVSTVTGTTRTRVHALLRSKKSRGSKKNGSWKNWTKQARTNRRPSM